MIGKMDVEIPDVVEPIRAYRAFVLLMKGISLESIVTGDEVPEGAHPILMSFRGGVTWPTRGEKARPYHPNEFIKAQCIFINRSPFTVWNQHACPCPPEDAPGHDGKGCGIYAYKSLVDLGTEFPRTPSWDAMIVWGEVSLWGHVYEHTLGWRAEFAQVESLIHTAGYGYMPEPWLRWIADSYGISVKTLSIEESHRLFLDIRKRDSPPQPNLYGNGWASRLLSKVAIWAIQKWSASQWTARKP